MKALYESLLDDEETLINDNSIMKKYVEEWARKNIVRDAYSDYTIDSKFRINSKKNITLKSDVEELPFPFGHVKGNFTSEPLSSKGLLSLKNMPKKVGGDVTIYNGRFSSLEGLPEEIGGILHLVKCHYIENLKGCSQKVSHISINFCDKLKSLEGAPEEVVSFYCAYNNNLIDLQGSPKKV